MAEENKTEETTEKKNIIEWCEEHPKTVFWIRFVFWVILAAGLPFAFIAWRYGLFKSGSTMQLSGWGLVAVVIIAVFLIVLIRYAFKGLKEGFLKQCITGFVAVVLPLLALYLLVDSIESNVSLFKQALGCVILCELSGIPVNPLPAWLAKRKQEDMDEKVDKASDKIWSKYFEKKKENDK